MRVRRWSAVVALTLAGEGCGLLAGTVPAGAGPTVSSPPKVLTGHLLSASGGTPASLVPGASLPLRDLGDYAFASATEGYALANTGSAVYPVVSTNGGRTWRVDGPHLWVAAADAPATVESMGTASTSTAFAFGGGQAVDVTSDGGARWYSTYFDNVLDVSALGDSIWVLANGSGTFGSSSLSPVWLYASSDGGQTWTFLSSLPGLDGLDAELVRPSATTAFVLVGKSTNAVTSSGIAETTDGGARWRTRADPCDENASPRIFLSQFLGAISPTRLWLACGGVPSSSSASTTQVKEVFSSTSAGAHWTAIAASAEIAFPPKSASLPLADALPITGTTGSTAFESASDASIILGTDSGPAVRAPNGIFEGKDLLEQTTDGGKTWHSPAPAVASQYPQRVVRAGSDLVVQTVNGLWSESPAGTWTLLAGTTTAAQS